MEPNYTVEQFYADVLHEATMLREKADKYEKHNLEVSILNYNDPKKCIYGLMCGHCRCERARQLINECCIRYIRHGEIFANIDEDVSLTESRSINVIINQANGTSLPEKERRGFSHFSTIEAYITIPDAKKAELIAYIKGEIDTLEL